MTDAFLAKNLFEYELGTAQEYGDEQFRFVAGQIDEKFYNNLTETLFTVILEPMNKEFERRIGASDNSWKSPVEAIEISNKVRGFIVRSDLGIHLVAWDSDLSALKTQSRIRVFPLLQELPKEIERQIVELVDGHPFSLDRLQAAASLAGGYAVSHLDDSGEAIPDGAEDLIAAIEQGGLTVFANDVATMTFTKLREDRDISVRGSNHWRTDIDVILHLADVFDINHEAGRHNVKNDEFLKALDNGNVKELRSSVAALALDARFDADMQSVREIFEIGERLGLSRTARLVFANSNRVVFTERTAERDLYIHNNQSQMEQLVYGMAFYGDGLEYSHVDIHIARQWYHDFPGDCVDPDEAMSMYTFARFIEHSRDHGGAPIEHEFLAAINAGKRPGLFGTFHFGQKRFEIGPAFKEAQMIPYLKPMIELDHAALIGAFDEDAALRKGMQIETREKDCRRYEDRVLVGIEQWFAEQGREIIVK